MSVEPTPGLVIRFDYLWKDEHQKGSEHGSKDRPCVIVITSKEHEDGSRDVVVCPVTHTPPTAKETAVEIPLKVARHLNLDSDRMWVKTHEVNVFKWDKDRLPFGMQKTKKGEWSHGKIPHGLRSQIHGQVRENAKSKSLSHVPRESDLSNPDFRKGRPSTERSAEHGSADTRTPEKAQTERILKRKETRERSRSRDEREGGRERGN